MPRPGKLVGLSREEMQQIGDAQRKVVSVVEDKRFEQVVGFVIVCAAAVAGFRQSEDAKDHNGATFAALVVLDQVILFLFVLEILVRMGARFPYFWSGWNVLDFMIVVSGLLEIILEAAVPGFADTDFALALRVVRLFRSFRIFRVFRQLMAIMNTLTKTIVGLRWIFLVLLIVFYLFAVIGVALLRDNDRFHFDDLGIALITLYRLLTFDSWTGVLYVSQYGCADFANEDGKCEASQAHGFWAVLYFVSFGLVAGFVVMNLIVSFIVLQVLQVSVVGEVEDDTDDEEDELVREVTVESMLRKSRNARKLLRNIRLDVNINYEG